MAPQVLEKKFALLFTYKKNRDNFQVSWTWTHFVKFPAIKKVISDCAISKKKEKGSSRRIYSCFFTDNGITTPKTTREGQESTTKTSLHLAWPPKFKNQVLFTPRAQSRFLDLGLLLRGCRPKSRSLPGRVEVIQPVVRACTTFWLTSTRITLTRVHRRWFEPRLQVPGFSRHLASRHLSRNTLFICLKQSKLFQIIQHYSTTTCSTHVFQMFSASVCIEDRLWEYPLAGGLALQSWAEDIWTSKIFLAKENH